MMKVTTKHKWQIRTMENSSPRRKMAAVIVIEAVKVGFNLLVDKCFSGKDSGRFERGICNYIDILFSYDQRVGFVCPVCVFEDDCIWYFFSLVVNPSLISFNKGVKGCFV